MDDNDWDIGAVVRNCGTPNLGYESMNFENDDWGFLNKPSSIVTPNLGSESMSFENGDWDFFNGPSNIVTPSLGSESFNFENDDSGFLNRPSNIVVPSLVSEIMNFENDESRFLNRPSNIVVPSLGSESMNFENGDSNFVNGPSNIVVPSLGSESINFENDDLGFLNRSSNVVVPNLGTESMNFENDDSGFLNRPNNIVVPNLSSESINFENDDQDVFKRLLDVDITSFDVLDDVIPMQFSVAHQGTPFNQSSEIINPTNPVPIIADQFKTMDQNDNQQMDLQPIQPVHDLNQQIFFPPPPVPTEVVESVPAPSEAITSQQLLDLEQQLMCADIHPKLTSTTRTPQIQNSERKNQPARIVFELLEEELDDTWRWRKYGRKKIKGCSFARNYYKCSTSDQCQARKLIEKSPNDDKIFLVGYSGTHNHDPPLSRSSVPGCNNNSKEKILKSISILPKPISLNASNRGGKRSRAAPETDEGTSSKKKKMVVVAGEDKVDGEEEDGMNEDVEELNGVSDDST